MATDDRFAQITAIIALTITAGLFLASNWSALFDRKTEATAAVTVQPGPSRVQPATAPLEPEAAFLRASNENPAPAAAPAPSAASESRPKVTKEPSLSTRRILESLASGWSDAALPSPSQILVRKDRDGRIIVAEGTHRRYGILLRELEELKPEEIKAELDISRASTGPSLRENLMNQIDGILEFKLPDAEPDMVPGRVAWHFADAEYRELPAPEQYLLLMGRSRAEELQETLADIRSLIEEGFPVETMDSPDLKELFAMKDSCEEGEESLATP